MRLVVTGQGPDGCSTLLHTQDYADADAASAPGMLFWQVSGVDGALRVPWTTPPAHGGGVYPAPGSVRVGITRFLGDGTREPVPDSRGNDVSDLLDDQGLHATDTVDIGWVISGEVGLRLTDGSVTWLEAGDLVLQGGVAHSWVSKPGVDALTGWVLLGAHRD
jgi:hypothetical protein